jgi:hypothetical protein
MEWEQTRPLPTAAGGDLHLVIDAAGAPALVGRGSTIVAPPATVVGDGVCAESLRLASDSNAVHAAWWSRAAERVTLMASSSFDGGATWNPPAVVDSLDRSGQCDRPAPSVAARGGSVYVAYSMRAPEGTGVFFSHAMDMPGMRGVFHSPVPVIYGDRMVAAAIAADGDRVAVAYEDPSARTPRIGVSISATEGHRFETHADVGGGAAVRAPEVALRTGVVAVAWSVDGDAAEEPARMVRVGRIR